MLRLYWQPKWMTAEEHRRSAADPMTNAGFILANSRMEKILNEAYEKGGEDSALKHQRVGTERFGQEIRKEMAQWVGTETREGFKDSVPMWALEQLLEKWNVPPLADKGAFRDKEQSHD